MREPRIRVLGRRLRRRQHRRKMNDAAEQQHTENPQRQADHEQLFRTTAGIGPSFVVSEATPIGVSYSRQTRTKRSIPPLGNQFPERARGPTLMTKRPVASRKISALVKPCRSIALATSRPSPIVERQRPVARRGRHAADDKCAAPVEHITRVVGAGIKGHAVAGSNRQLTGSGDVGARIRIDVDRSTLRPCRPCADGHCAERDPARQRQPSRAEPNRRREYQCEAGAQEQSHVRSDRLAVISSAGRLVAAGNSGGLLLAGRCQRVDAASPPPSSPRVAAGAVSAGMARIASSSRCSTRTSASVPFRVSRICCGAGAPWSAASATVGACCGGGSPGSGRNSTDWCA